MWSGWCDCRAVTDLDVLMSFLPEVVHKTLCNKEHCCWRESDPLLRFGCSSRGTKTRQQQQARDRDRDSSISRYSAAAHPAEGRAVHNSSVVEPATAG
jgi:hypothetical protein